MSQRLLVRALIALLFASSRAFWRLPCRGRTGVARIDPLADPHRIAHHPHALHGANKIGFSSTYNDLTRSTCTSCAVKQDKSAYWIPPLYFQHANGSTQIVQQVGGLLVYYLLFGQNITAFPPGFSMIAGQTNKRTFDLPIPDPPKSLWTAEDRAQPALMAKAVGFNCLDYKKHPEGTLYRHFLPSKDYVDDNCRDGLRLEIMFPSCWDGSNVDSPDHQSHVAYPDLVIDGRCPEGYLYRIPSLLYESIWNTYAFKDFEGRFIIGNGDPTGYGYHGDFLNGWEGDVLQEAIETCTDDSGLIELCPAFKLQGDYESQQCLLEYPSVIRGEDCEGLGEGLCGNIPVWPSTSPPTKTTVRTSSPHLGYSSGTKVVTDNHGGAITVARTADSGLATPKPFTYTGPTQDTFSSEVPAPEFTRSVDIHLAPKPTVASEWDDQPSKLGHAHTRAIVTEEAVSATEEISGTPLYTSVFTSSRALVEIAVHRVDVTVTQSYHATTESPQSSLAPTGALTDIFTEIQSKL